MRKIYHLAIQGMEALPVGMRRSFTKGITYLLLKRYATVNVINQRVLKDREGQATLFIANHLSNIDGVILNRLLRKNEVAFLAGMKLEDNSVTRIIKESIETIPINPETADRNAIKLCLQRLKSGKSILIFPEGTRSRSRQMLRAKKGFILIARKAGVPLVPLGLEGTEKLLPINDQNMGAESLQKAIVTITVGEPFLLPKRDQFPNIEDHGQETTDFCMAKIASLVSADYRGVYQGFVE